jgi:cellulose synthase/poly-beta-1,6-N-acetylglucosamine synthase-like glycosyltransferase
MISVCIPVYNFDVRPLVNELISQIEGLDCELILIDDASSECVFSHEELNAKTKFIRLNENVGRSKIRNLFLSESTCPYLLFLDCDSIIEKKDFIATYLEAIKKGNTKVICGGRYYPDSSPSKTQMLRWKYGVESESKTAEERLANPYKSFMTNNFLVDRSVFEKIQFDETLTKYGHEDTLFGFELKNNKVRIDHIENAILNGELESNQLYLSKTELGVKNLVKIVNSLDEPDDFIDDVYLLSFYREAKEKGKIKNFKRLQSIFGKRILKKLVKGLASVKQFNFFKLMLLVKYLESEEVEKTKT